MSKKGFFKFSGIVVLLVIILLIVAIAFAGPIIKTSIEKVGSKVTKCDITVENVDLSVFKGSLLIENLVVGNPEGFKTESAFKLAKVFVSLKPMSLVGKKIIVTDVQVIGPEITYELAPLKMTSNIGVIQGNVQEFLPTSEETEKTEGKPVEIDHVIVKDGNISVSATFAGGHALTIPLPAIELNDIGKEKDINSAQATARVLNETLGSVVSAASSGSKSIGSGIKGLFSKDNTDAAKEATSDAVEATKKSANDAVNAVEDKAKEASKSIKGLFGK